MEYFTLNNGVQLPKVGFGVYKIKNKHEDVMVSALQSGYRHLDTAAIYHNEEIVADAIRKSGVKRSDVFLTTKLWSSDVGAKTTQAFEKSLRKLQTDYVDLFLIHWPVKGYMESWHTLEKLYHAGKIRAIGVSNFEREHLDTIMRDGTVVPAVNQVQTNPYLQQEELHSYLKTHGIQQVGWGPFGQGNKMMFQDPVLTSIARNHGKTTAQIMLRWSIQRDIAVIPKSANPERLRMNLALFDFQLSGEEMRLIADLERNQRGFNDPRNKLFMWMSRFIR